MVFWERKEPTQVTNSQTKLSLTARCLSLKKLLGKPTSVMKNKRLANQADMNGMVVVIQAASFWDAVDLGSIFPVRVMFGLWHFCLTPAEVQCTKSRTVELGMQQ